MLTKLALVLHGKLLATAVAGLVLIGGGTAVAVAATTGALPGEHGASISTHDSNDDHGGAATKTPGTDNQNDGQHERHGVASNIGADSFTLTPANGAPVTVAVSAQTRFHDLKGISDLKEGDQVEVKGALQSDGTFSATDVERSNDAEGSDDNGGSNGDGNQQSAEDVRGTVQIVGADSFVILVTSMEGDGSSTAHAGAKMTVTTSTATMFKDLSGVGALKQGDSVEVKGTLQSDGSLSAASVERSSGGDGGSGGGSGTGSGSGSGDGGH